MHVIYLTTVQMDSHFGRWYEFISCIDINILKLNLKMALNSMKEITFYMGRFCNVFFVYFIHTMPLKIHGMKLYR
jgi:hypothetical protein